MKRCPFCYRTYPDGERFTFCMEDGRLLSPPYNPAETQILPTPYDVDLPTTDDQECEIRRACVNYESDDWASQR